uniref:Uncharacterized protein n=1 Tax=Cucumis melo TaxID=3656 RepID=A0A9I9EGT6_CUCME
MDSRVHNFLKPHDSILFRIMLSAVIWGRMEENISNTTNMEPTLMFFFYANNDNVHIAAYGIVSLWCLVYHCEASDFFQ